MIKRNLFLEHSKACLVWGPDWGRDYHLLRKPWSFEGQSISSKVDESVLLDFQKMISPRRGAGIFVLFLVRGHAILGVPFSTLTELRVSFSQFSDILWNMGILSGSFS